MIKKASLVLGLVFLMGICLAQDIQTKHTFEIGPNDFMYDGKPVVIRSGEIHFTRVPREYWQQRLHMIKAMGFNAIGTYLFWNVHEPEPDKFNWSNMADAVAFFRMAQKEGLFVILRPGPYACAEWDMGGFPWWFLKQKDLKVRTQDPYFLDRCQKYLTEVGRVLAPLQVSKGGPIIMVQVENEYGYFGSDREYVRKIYAMIKNAGFEVPLYTCDQGGTIKKDACPEIFSTINFGSNPEQNFKDLREVRPTGPLMCAEYYPGWFDVWGAPHKTGTIEKLQKEIGYMMDHRASFSLYMVHGGTTFGLWAGANGFPYSPTISSYDYDAPISEAGWETPKFMAMRALMAKNLNPGESIPDVPARNPVISIPEFSLGEVAAVAENLPTPIADERARNMEAYNQAYGCIMYRTTLAAGPAASLEIRDLRDYAIILLDGKKVATLDISRKQFSCILPARDKNSVLDIFVEPMGRINFGNFMLNKKGIAGPVNLIAGNETRELLQWQVYLFPMGEGMPANLKFTHQKTSNPAFYHATFEVEKPGDSFLDLSTWGKGVVWVNGHCLGRFWSIGPTQTMYLPAPWLQKGNNEITIFDVSGPQKASIQGVTEPVLDKLNVTMPAKNRKPSQTLIVANNTPTISGTFEAGSEWQTVSFSAAARYLCLEATDSQNGDEFTTIAELYALDKKGNELPRDKWKILYADSEEVMAEDGRADNIFDMQFTNYWITEKKAGRHPHQIVIDLGSEQTVGGIKYLPRQDQNIGRIRHYRIFTSTAPFAGI